MYVGVVVDVDERGLAFTGATLGAIDGKASVELGRLGGDLPAKKKGGSEWTRP